MLLEMFSNSTMVMPTMSVIFPEPYIVRIDPAYTLLGLVNMVPEVMTVIVATTS